MSHSSRSLSPSHSQSRSLPRAASPSEGRTASESQRHQTTDPTEDTSMAISSSIGSSPRVVLPPPPPVPVAATLHYRGPRTRLTARKQVILPGRLPDRMAARQEGPSQPIPSHLPFGHPPEVPRNPTMDHYSWERQFEREEMQRARDAEAARQRMPPTLQPPPPAAFLHLHREVRGLAQETQNQGHLISEVTDSAERLSEQALRFIASTRATARTVQRLIGMCLVMGTLIVVMAAKMFLDRRH